MKRDGILLLFLSEYREKSDMVCYMADGEGGEEQYFDGIQTNDAPVKYLIYKAAENGDLIQKILYIITEKVKRVEIIKNLNKC